jgi:ribosome-associated protein
MDIKKLQRAVVDGLEDVKAQHIAVFNTEHLSSMFERVIIASGTSNRQTKALAASVRNAVKSRGMQVLSTEGEDNGEWIIVDCGAAVVHIMQPTVREYYHLEEIWGGKAVKMKVGEVKTGLVKASSPEDQLPGAKRAPAKKAAAKKAPARKTAGSEEQKASNRTAAFKRVAAKKTPYRAAAPDAPATKTVVVKSSARKVAAPAKKSAAKSPARSPAKSSAKAPARKAPAKTAAKPRTRS